MSAVIIYKKWFTMNAKSAFFICAISVVMVAGSLRPHGTNEVIIRQDHLPERPPYHDATRTSLSVTSVVTSTATTTTVPYSL
jgi:hypothetical protein